MCAKFGQCGIIMNKFSITSRNVEYSRTLYVIYGHPTLHYKNLSFHFEDGQKFYGVRQKNNNDITNIIEYNF